MAPQNNYTGKLFELSIISAQDLAAVSKSMRTYAVAWIDPERKLTTRVDENGHANPKWNEKFIFRVDDDVLVSDNAMVMIEIYALTWLRVVLIGTVCFHISTLIPPSSRPRSNKASAVAGGGAASTTRFATLQIRRPSGRPQGTLNIGVAIVSSTMRSMPLQSDLTASSTLTYGGSDVPVEPNPNSPKSNASQDRDPKDNAGRPNLRRSQSEMFSDKVSYNNYPAGSVINESALTASQIGFKIKGGGGGGSQLGSLVSSDVGPSASVVAAAIAKGLYPRPNDDGGSSILDNWTEQDSVEGLKSKIERWRKEAPPVYNRENRKGKAGASAGKDLPPVPPRRRHSDGGSGLFSCFGNAYGCEFSISCGGGGKKNSKYLGGRNSR